MDAVMNQPRGVAVGSENDLFIADYNNSRIRMVDPAEGTIETVAGGGDPVQDSSEYDGALATAVAFTPAGICFGRDGNLYVTTDLDEVLKVNSDGIITWVAGDFALDFSGDGGPATEAGLSYPTGVFAYSDGTVLIADRDHNRIRRVDPDGTISTIAGSGPADSGGFSGDGGPATEAMLYGPSGVTVGPGGEIYIADTYNHRIRKVDTDGTISTVAGSGPDGAEEGRFGGDGGPATLANLSVPINVIVTNEGTIYITDSYNHCIRRVDTEGNIDTVVGDNQAGFSGDGNPATTAQFYFPEGIAFDSEGNLYIADSWNHRVRAVMALESAGAVVVGGTVAKTPEEAANFDGDATVGFGDFLVFAGGFGSQSSDDGFDPRLDLDGDGAVGFGDFLMFAAVFGQTI
jgi:sugar lactone lactonase YvrE